MGRTPGAKNKTKTDESADVDLEPTIGTRTINGLEYVELDEMYRTYEFPNGRQVQFDSVKFLNVSASGGHRLITVDGKLFYVKPRESWFMQIEHNAWAPKGFIV